MKVRLAMTRTILRDYYGPSFMLASHGSFTFGWNGIWHNLWRSRCLDLLDTLADQHAAVKGLSIYAISP